MAFLEISKQSDMMRNAQFHQLLTITVSREKQTEGFGTKKLLKVRRKLMIHAALVDIAAGTKERIQLPSMAVADLSFTRAQY